VSHNVNCPYCDEILPYQIVEETFIDNDGDIDPDQMGRMETVVCNGCNRWFVLEFADIIVQATPHKIEGVI